MGTLTAGIKEIFSSAKTTGSNVMLCGNDGTPDGHMTMANLASVLGGNKSNRLMYYVQEYQGTLAKDETLTFKTEDSCLLFIEETVRTGKTAVYLVYYQSADTIISAPPSEFNVTFGNQYSVTITGAHAQGSSIRVRKVYIA